MYQHIEDKADNRAIDKAYFEKCLPGYTLINKYIHQLKIQTLMTYLQSTRLH